MLISDNILQREFYKLSETKATIKKMFRYTVALFATLYLFLCAGTFISSDQSSDSRDTELVSMTQEVLPENVGSVSNLAEFVKREVKMYRDDILGNSVRKLEMIVDRMDNDADSYVTMEELKDWIASKRRMYEQGNVDMQWKSYTTPNQKLLTWWEYKKHVYGYLDNVSEDHKEDAQKMLIWDRRRWSVLDTDDTDSLSYDQFKTFLYPEGVKHTSDLLVEEEMEEVDTNKDGRISLEEYLGGTFMAADRYEEPEWVSINIDYFVKSLDLDADGYMDLTAVHGWVQRNSNVAEVEARYMMFKTDKNGDGKLTKEEVVDQYDLFLKSHATEMGSALVWRDEL